MPIHHINFDAFVDEEESETDDFKEFYKKLNDITRQYLGGRLTPDMFNLLMCDLENVVLEYKSLHPESSFKIRPEHRFAYRRQILSPYEVWELHEKYCLGIPDKEVIPEKEEYTGRDVNNMLFDLMAVKQVLGYEKIPEFIFDEVYDMGIVVLLRMYDYI